MTDLAIIVARAKNGVIGGMNTLPWHLPADLKRFKAITMGHPIIMGRRTWESLPIKPLPGRPHFVVSGRTEIQPSRNVNWYTNPMAAMSAAKGHAAAKKLTTAFIIGGGQLYECAMPYVKTLHITSLADDFRGDVYFPQISQESWQLTKTITKTTEDDPKAPCAYRFETYVRLMDPAPLLHRPNWVEPQ